MMAREGSGSISANSDNGATGQFTKVEIPRRFGRYETLFRIAGGGMAEVFAARLVGSGGFEKVVAVKRMLPALADDPHFVSMFLDEARLAASIESPHVVRTLELGQADDGSLFLVMELVVGLPLHRLIRASVDAGKAIPVDVAVDILVQAASGLHDAHEATTAGGEPLSVVHRDISPQNVLVARDGRVRIMDFGVAKALQRSTHTATGEVKGKLAYFAPEQAAGDRSLDRRADIFSLGIVAWECLTSRRLFRGDNPVETVRNLMAGVVPPVREFRGDVPEEIDRVLATAMAHDREARYPTAAAFASALRAAVPPSERAATADYVRLVASTYLEPFESALAMARNREVDRTASRAQWGVEVLTATVAPTRRRKRALAGLMAGLGLGLAVAWSIRGADEERTHSQAEPRHGAALESATNKPPVLAQEAIDAHAVDGGSIDEDSFASATPDAGSTAGTARLYRRSEGRGTPRPTQSPTAETAPDVQPERGEPTPRAPGLQTLEEFEQHLP